MVRGRRRRHLLLWGCLSLCPHLGSEIRSYPLEISPSPPLKAAPLLTYAPNPLEASRGELQRRWGWGWGWGGSVGIACVRLARGWLQSAAM